MRFPAKFARSKEGGFVVTFPDIPEAITQGDNVDDAMHHAADALESALDFYFEEGRRVPMRRGPGGASIWLNCLPACRQRFFC
ncbi:MAG: type II toxin-antitoxin system HicB family antitoxin [Terracidiphilus sp.]